MKKMINKLLFLVTGKLNTTTRLGLIIVLNVINIICLLAILNDITVLGLFEKLKSFFENNQETLDSALLEETCDTDTTNETRQEIENKEQKNEQTSQENPSDSKQNSENNTKKSFMAKIKPYAPAIICGILGLALLVGLGVSIYNNYGSSGGGGPDLPPAKPSPSVCPSGSRGLSDLLVVQEPNSRIITRGMVFPMIQDFQDVTEMPEIQKRPEVLEVPEIQNVMERTDSEELQEFVQLLEDIENAEYLREILEGIKDVPDLQKRPELQKLFEDALRERIQDLKDIETFQKMKGVEETSPEILESIQNMREIQEILKIPGIVEIQGVPELLNVYVPEVPEIQDLQKMQEILERAKEMPEIQKRPEVLECIMERIRVREAIQVVPDIPGIRYRDPSEIQDELFDFEEAVHQDLLRRVRETDDESILTRYYMRSK